MKLKYCLLAILWPVLNSCAQNASTSKPLNVGDTIPYIILTDVINFPVSKIHLSNLKGKVVILDFWSSWCGSCISLFPHLDSLQRRFKDELQIILVNTKSQTSNDDETKIKKILDRVRSKTGSAIDIPVVYNCKKLDEYFPCIAIPHEVWIDKNGVVAGITAAEEVNDTNIQALLNGDKVKMKLKKDRFDVDLDKPLFIDGNAGDGSETIYRSVLTENIDGLSGATGIRRDGDKVTGFYCINQSLLSLIKTAYGKQIPYSDNRIIRRGKEKFSKVYSYELIVPATTIEKFLSYVRDDLKRYFNISVKKEKRKMRCLVLKAAFPVKCASPEKQSDLDIEEATLHKYVYNYPPSFVTGLLNNYSAIPIIDETNISSNICIDLPFVLMDIPQLKKAFLKIGFELKEENRELEVVVISDI